MKRINLPEDWRSFDYGSVGDDACVVRYGAFGDMIQSATVFPALKERLHHVVLSTTTRGYEIIRNDPNIDTVLVQGNDQIKNEELGEFWGLLKRPFRKFINLSESVERSLLTVEGDRAFNWNKDFRDMVMNVDYIEGVHAIAGIKGAKKRPFFYPSKSEKELAEKTRLGLGLKNKVIMWVISGSSVHKIWPYMDAVFARLMVNYDNVKIVTVGDDLCKMIEYPWTNEKRVIRKSGKWGIRNTMSFIPYCDVIVGPETGVMNAAAYLDVPKVAFLSHSSISNFGHDWVNASVLAPENTECYPCHKLHYTWRTCVKNDLTGVAECASNIKLDTVYGAIVRWLDEQHIS